MTNRRGSQHNELTKLFSKVGQEPKKKKPQRSKHGGAMTTQEEKATHKSIQKPHKRRKVHTKKSGGSDLQTKKVLYTTLTARRSKKLTSNGQRHEKTRQQKSMEKKRKDEVEVKFSEGRAVKKLKRDGRRFTQEGVFIKLC